MMNDVTIHIRGWSRLEDIGVMSAETVLALTVRHPKISAPMYVHSISHFMGGSRTGRPYETYAGSNPVFGFHMPVDEGSTTAKTLVNPKARRMFEEFAGQKFTAHREATLRYIALWCAVRWPHLVLEDDDWWANYGREDKGLLLLHAFGMYDAVFGGVQR